MSISWFCILVGLVLMVISLGLAVTGKTNDDFKGTSSRACAAMILFAIGFALAYGGLMMHVGESRSPAAHTSRLLFFNSLATID
jgi:uncharacterized integral membrane protein